LLIVLMVCGKWSDQRLADSWQTWMTTTKTHKTKYTTHLCHNGWHLLTIKLLIISQWLDNNWSTSSSHATFKTVTFTLSQQRGKSTNAHTT